MNKQIKGKIIININGSDIPWENLSIDQQNEVEKQLSNKLFTVLNLMQKEK